MGRKRPRGGLCLYCSSFALGAALVFLIYTHTGGPHRPCQRPRRVHQGAHPQSRECGKIASRQRSLHVSLRSHVNSLGLANPKPRKQLDRGPFRSHLQEGWEIPRDHPRPGSLPTQKMMQEGIINPTKGRSRSGPVQSCEQFQSRNYTWPAGMQTVAIVGNGPLTPESREEINGMDLVIRFNKLQSYVCGDKFDVWASRHGDAVSTRYWGIGQKLNITDCPLEKLLRHAKHIWLMNGGDGPFNFFMQSYPYIRDRVRYLWIDCRRWVSRYLVQYDRKRREGGLPSTQDEVSPSSGWLVIMMLRECAPAGLKYHIYGFNWPGGQWPAHKVEEEHEEIEGMEADGSVVIHKTLCKHKYHCNSTLYHK